MNVVYSTKRTPPASISKNVAAGLGDCIMAVWLRREGAENDTSADVVVDVEIAGKWYELIREGIDGAFSHCARPDAIRRESQLDITEDSND